jgi:hypothetical protein
MTQLRDAATRQKDVRARRIDIEKLSHWQSKSDIGSAFHQPWCSFEKK